MRLFFSIFLHLCILATSVRADELRSGFVYLSDVDPSILINLKYHRSENFTGKPVRGCKRSRAVVTQEAAEALRNVQEDLVMYGYSLVVYDAYHPKKSYDEFNNWLQSKDSKEIKNSHYPNLKKADIKSRGYIKAKYAHVRGSTVDVTIISLKEKLKSPGKKKKRSYKGQKDIIYVYDGSLDMGTSHDVFDPLSEFDNENIPEIARDNRKMLKDAMQNHGFTANNKFWWQFTLIREPYVDSKFDFDV